MCARAKSSLLAWNWPGEALTLCMLESILSFIWVFRRRRWYRHAKKPASSTSTSMTGTTIATVRLIFPFFSPSSAPAGNTHVPMSTHDSTFRSATPSWLTRM